MTTIRIFFEKRGEAAYISLLDLQRVFQRLLKISGLPVWYTQGFNPHIYLAFSSPLSLGQESLCESCEVKTEDGHFDGAAWAAALQPLMPRGIRITRVAPAQQKMGEIASAAYRITMPAASAPALDAYNAAGSAPVLKKTKRGQKTLELKDYIPTVDYRLEGEMLCFEIMLPSGSGDGPNLNPALLLGVLQPMGGAPAWQCQVLRTHLYTKNGAEFC